MPYFHVVFTLPHALIPLCQRNPRVLYDLLFQASAAALLEVAADPKHLGAQIGFLSILHTWGQNLLPHPHVHCVIPAGGLSPDRTSWVHPKYPFFLPVRSAGVSGQIRGPPEASFSQEETAVSPANAALEQPKLFLRISSHLFREDWVVYAKPAFGGSGKVLRYLGRYTHRVAISNHRLLAFDGERVTFRWKDYARGNKQRQMTLTATEFLRRFLQHVLPRGFVRIRQFGFLANSCRTARLAPYPGTPSSAPRALYSGCFGGSHLELPALWWTDENRRSPHRGGVSLSVQFLRQLVDLTSIGPMTCVRVPAWSCVYRLINAVRLPAPGSFWLCKIATSHLASIKDRPFRRTPQPSVHFGCLQTSL